MITIPGSLRFTREDSIPTGLPLAVLGRLRSVFASRRQSNPGFYNHSSKRPYILFLCREWGSNPHPVRDTILSRARIPVPPSRQHYSGIVILNIMHKITLHLKSPSGKLRHSSTMCNILLVDNTKKHYPRVRPVGIEPTTVRLRGDCSTN